MVDSSAEAVVVSQPLVVSGTFLDEVTCDIPAQNWGRQEWEREFQTFVDTGIDTVILIRSGWGERLSHPSAVLASKVPTLPVYFDQVELFLELADRHDLRFFFGLYDSGYHWQRNDWRQEVAINTPYSKEVWDRYGHHRSFRGWYLPHETADSSSRIIDLNCALAEVVRSTAELPVLVSPYFLRRFDMVSNVGRLGAPRSLEEHVTQWEEIFAKYQGLVDVAAFQDGTCGEGLLDETLAATRHLADRYGIELWTNVETFDRDMPIKFPPIEWRKLVHKLTVASRHVEKAITFEFSHFLSPNSMWPSARCLYDRYQEYTRGEYPAPRSAT